MGGAVQTSGGLKSGAGATGRSVSSRWKLHSLLWLAMVAVVLLVATVYTIVVFQLRRADMIHDSNERLFSAASFARP